MMELVDGNERLSRPMPLDEALRIAHANRRGARSGARKRITHRDLKPANIMVTRRQASSRCWISDWPHVGAHGSSDSGEELATITMA